MRGMKVGTIAVAILLIVALCAMTTPVSAAPDGIPSHKVISEAYNWLGTPYVWGGESKRGVDCSGLVRQVYMRASGGYAYYYDRSAAGIKAKASQVSYPSRGDVVLFQKKSTGSWSHVGIYISNGYFIHADSYKGKVVMDHLYYSCYGNGWWSRNYNIRFARYNPDYWIA